MKQALFFQAEEQKNIFTFVFLFFRLKNKAHVSI